MGAYLVLWRLEQVWVDVELLTQLLQPPIFVLLAEEVAVMLR